MVVPRRALGTLACQRRISRTEVPNHGIALSTFQAGSCVLAEAAPERAGLDRRCIIRGIFPPVHRIRVNSSPFGVQISSSKNVTFDPSQ